MKRYGTSFLLITAMLLCTSCSGLKTYHLKNGIPVYVKNDTGKKIDAVYIVVKGGVALLKPEQSGFEEAVFTDMTYASGHFTDTERTQLLNQTRSSILCASGENGSSLRLECIDSYLYKDIPVFTDSFMHPVFNRELFDILMRNCSQRVSFMLNDPQSFLLYSAWKNIYSGHPLETQPGVTPESIGNFSLISLAAFHRTLLDSRRISVIAAGSMNGPGLVRELNKTLGTIASGTGPLRIPEMKDVEVNGPPVVLTLPAAAGTGFAARVFRTPSVQSDDYIAADIAARMYSGNLNNVVRVKYGACYTPATFFYTSHASCGCEFLYNVSDRVHFAAYVKEARDLMASGKLLSSVGSDGSYGYADISERLEGFINSYLTEKYSTLQTSSGMAGMLCDALLDTDSVSTSVGFEKRVRSVTAGDVLRVFRKYWVDGSSRWFAVVGPGDETAIRFD